MKMIKFAALAFAIAQITLVGGAHAGHGVTAAPAFSIEARRADESPRDFADRLGSDARRYCRSVFSGRTSASAAEGCNRMLVDSVMRLMKDKQAARMQSF